MQSNNEKLNILVIFKQTLTNAKGCNKTQNTHDWNNDKPYECGLETLDGG